MSLRRESMVQTPFQKIEVWKSSRQCEFRVAGAIHAWFHQDRFLTGLAWDNLAAATLLHPSRQPTSILMLGLAGGTSLRILRHLLPQAHLVAVDIDPEIVLLARTHMHLDQLKANVHLADAYEWLHSSRETFDVIIDDLYLAGPTDVFRPHEADSRHLLQLRSHLNPDGIILANLVTGKGHRRSQSTARQAFRSTFPITRSVTTPASLNETLVGGTTLAPSSSLSPWLHAFTHPTDRRHWKSLRVRTLSPR